MVGTYLAEMHEAGEEEVGKVHFDCLVDEAPERFPVITSSRSRSPEVVETYVRLLIPTKLPLKV